MTSKNRRTRTSKIQKQRTAQPTLTQLFAARLHELRTVKHLTLDELVKLGGGGSAGRLSRLERGAVSPTLRSVEEIARALDVDPIELLIDPRIELRHRLVAGAAGAKPRAMQAALAVLDGPQQLAPSARALRRRWAALPVWAQPVVQRAVSALLRDEPMAFADAVLELTDADLAVVEGVIDALEHVERAAGRYRPEPFPRRTTRRT